MSEIYYNQTASTIGQVVFTACCLFFTQIHTAGTIKNENPALQNTNTYVWKSNRATFDYYSNPLTGEYSLAVDQFEQVISSFYSHLLATQESLGVQLEKIIHENLWDLYES